MRKENIIKIPKQFELLGQTIKVTWDNDKLNNEGLYGLVNCRKNLIQLTNECVIDGERKKMPQDKINATFMHELTHFILHAMNNKLESNEDFVCLFSELLYQFHKTAKY